MHCDFIQSGDYCVCTRPECKRKLKKSQHPCDKHHAQCGKRGPQPVYLGDRVELRLHKLGITNERIKRWRRDYVKAWVATAGVTSPLIESVKFEPKCGCQWRKEVLNRLDRWVRRKLA